MKTSLKALEAVYGGIHDKDIKLFKPEGGIARQGRIFNEVMIDALSPRDKDLVNDFFKQDSSFLEMIEKVKQFKEPIKEKYVKQVFDLIVKINNNLTDDPGWNDFWNEVRDNQNLNENQIQSLKEDALYSYRFKIINLLTPHITPILSEINVNKDQLKNASDFLQKLNGEYHRGKRTSNELYDGAKNFFAVELGQACAREINIYIDKAVKELQAGKKEGEVLQELIKKTTKYKNETLSDPKNKFGRLYGEGAASETFEYLFNEETIKQKLNNRHESSNSLGFNIDDKKNELVTSKTLFTNHAKDIIEKKEYDAGLAAFNEVIKLCGALGLFHQAAKIDDIAKPFDDQALQDFKAKYDILNKIYIPIIEKIKFTQAKSSLLETLEAEIKRQEADIKNSRLARFTTKSDKLEALKAYREAIKKTTAPQELSGALSKLPQKDQTILNDPKRSPATKVALESIQSQINEISKNKVDQQPEPKQEEPFGNIRVTQTHQIQTQVIKPPSPPPQPWTKPNKPGYKAQGGQLRSRPQNTEKPASTTPGFDAKRATHTQNKGPKTETAPPQRPPLPARKNHKP
ncbi:MAG: hypothetical protein U1E78_09370 [Gammaproteobacteria bacterium]